MKTAVIGGGVMGREHLKWLVRISEVEIVAVVDPHVESARGALEGAGLDAGRAFDDVSAMLQSAAPEYVIVASPVRYHAEQVIAAYAAGAHVLCEKPLCMSVAQAEAMRDAAQRADRLFTMGLQIRQDPAVRALRDLIAAGRLGDIYHTRVWGGHVMSYPWGRYFHKRAESRGGVLMATTVHPFDAAYWTIGAPAPVTVSGSTFNKLTKMDRPPIRFEGELSEVDVEDFGQAHVRFADGSSMSIEGNWLHPPTPRGHGFEIFGVRGVGRDIEPHVQVWDGEKAETVAVDLQAAPEPENRTLAEHQQFLAAIGGADIDLVTFDEAINVQRILEAIYTSAETRAEVRL